MYTLTLILKKFDDKDWQAHAIIGGEFGYFEAYYHGTTRAQASKRAMDWANTRLPKEL